jgi:hypothetical protein
MGPGSCSAVMRPLQPSHSPCRALSTGSSAETSPPTFRLRPASRGRVARRRSGSRFDTMSSSYRPRMLPAPQRGVARGSGICVKTSGRPQRAAAIQSNSPATATGSARRQRAWLRRGGPTRTDSSATPNSLNISSSVRSSPKAIRRAPAPSCSRSQTTAMLLRICDGRTSNISTPSSRAKPGA